MDWILPAKGKFLRYNEYIVLSSAIRENTGVLLQRCNPHADPIWKTLIVGTLYNITRRYMKSTVVLVVDPDNVTAICELINAINNVSAGLITPNQSLTKRDSIWANKQVVVTSHAELVQQDMISREAISPTKIRALLRVTSCEELPVPLQELVNKVKKVDVAFRSINVLIKDKLWKHCEEEALVRALSTLQINNLIVQDESSYNLLTIDQLGRSLDRELVLVGYVVNQLRKSQTGTDNVRKFWTMGRHKVVEWNEIVNENCNYKMEGLSQIHETIPDEMEPHQHCAPENNPSQTSPKPPASTATISTPFLSCSNHNELASNHNEPRTHDQIAITLSSSSLPGDIQQTPVPNHVPSGLPGSPMEISSGSSNEGSIPSSSQCSTPESKKKMALAWLADRVAEVSTPSSSEESPKITETEHLPVNNPFKRKKHVPRCSQSFARDKERWFMDLDSPPKKRNKKP